MAFMRSSIFYFELPPEDIKPSKPKIGASTKHKPVGTDINGKDLDKVLAEIENLISEDEKE